MLRWMMAASVLLLLVPAGVQTAQDGKGKKPLGTWTRDLGEGKVAFKITADQLHCTITAMGGTLDVYADYAVSKDGYLFGRIHRVEKKAFEFGPSAGDLFCFRYTMKGADLVIGELSGSDAAAAGRELVEGTYKATKE